MEKLLGEKRRYKLYKAKSKWVVSAIITISGVTFLVTSPVSNAQADTVTGSESVKTEATQASVQSVQDNANAQKSVTKMKNAAPEEELRLHLFCLARRKEVGNVG